MSGRNAGYRQRLFQAVHAEALKRRMDHDALHDMCAKNYSVHSMSELTDAQLLAIYRMWTGKVIPRRERLADPDWRQRDAMVSGEEIANIAAQAARLGWGEETLANFVARQLKGRRVIRSHKDYARVVTPMQRIAERREADERKEQTA